SRSRRTYPRRWPSGSRSFRRRSRRPGWRPRSRPRRTALAAPRCCPRSGPVRAGTRSRPGRPPSSLLRRRLRAPTRLPTTASSLSFVALFLLVIRVWSGGAYLGPAHCRRCAHGPHRCNHRPRCEKVIDGFSDFPGTDSPVTDASGWRDMARRTASETPVVGRDHVRERLDALADAVRDDRGGALVLAGARGTGRTTLLATVAAHARGAEVAGAEGEDDMPWAGVQRLADAAGVALDTRDGDVPGVGAALLERLADRGPVVCLVDDAHRLDEPSLDTLAFVARRCGSLPVGIVCAVLPSDPALQRLAGLDVEPLPPLSDDDALRLVAERNSRIAPPVAAELVATAGGNPSDLCELVGALTAAQAVGGQAPPRSLPSGGRGRTAVLAAYRRLSDDAARFVLRLACADGAELAGGEPDADVLAEVQRSGLVWMAGDGPRPCSPAVGATLYDAAGERERRRAHARLADSIDPQQRRASWEWHTARADGRSDAAVADVVAAVADDHPETAALAWHRA